MISVSLKRKVTPYKKAPAVSRMKYSRRFPFYYNTLVKLFLRELLAGEQLVSFFVFGNGLFNNILRQDFRIVGLQVVADKLFVVRRLGLAGFVTLQGPEAAVVGSRIQIWCRR